MADLIWVSCLVLQASQAVAYQSEYPPGYMDIGQVGTSPPVCFIFHVPKLLGKNLACFRKTGVVEYSNHRQKFDQLHLKETWWEWSFPPLVKVKKRPVTSMLLCSHQFNVPKVAKQNLGRF